MLQLKRIYEAPSPEDGARILVERLWPRGVSKERAALSLWMKEIAPSTELRKWYNHDLQKWPAFRKQYWAELGEKQDLLAQLETLLADGNVTFVYASRQDVPNSAQALKEYLEQKH